MTFGETLRRERKKRRMLQGPVAELLGVDQTTISRWESGVRPAVNKADWPRLLAALAEFLHVTEAEVAALVAQADVEDSDSRMARLEAAVVRMQAQLDQLEARLEGDD